MLPELFVGVNSQITLALLLSELIEVAVPDQLVEAASLLFLQLSLELP